MIRFLDEDQNEKVVEFSEEEEHDAFHNHRTKSNKTALISEWKSSISVFNGKFCKELSFPCLFPNGKFSYNVECDMPISPVTYFNQRLLIYTQGFPGDVDYIFFSLDQ